MQDGFILLKTLDGSLVLMVQLGTLLFVLLVILLKAVLICSKSWSSFRWQIFQIQMGDVRGSLGDNS